MKDSEVDVEASGNWMARPARVQAKRQALESLPGLRQDYEEALAARWGAIFVSGEPAAVATFCKEASEKGPAVVVDAQQFYKALAAMVEPAMRKDRSFEPSQFAHLLSNFEHEVKALNIQGAPVIRYRGAKILADEAAVAEHIRELVNQQDGLPVVAAAMRRQITGEAFKMRYQRSALPVIVTGADSNEIAGLTPLFGGRVTSVVLEGEVTDETIQNAFQKLKTHYEKNKGISA